MASPGLLDQRRAYWLRAAEAMLFTPSSMLMRSLFQNWLTASLMAPSAAGLMAMPWATEGTRPPVLAVSTKSLLESLAQSSNLSMGMFRRTGMEPLFRLNTSWNGGLMMAAARSAWAFCAPASFSLYIANESTLKVKALAVPGAAAHR